ncbi:MAG: NAD+ synthase [Candidatus Lokiarchaeota archaeon]|nr:NAD+ synthase [Candidatus Lokiarchaeota archaeon]
MRELNFEKLVLDIQNWISNYVKSANAENIIVGLSGGIDSAVTAALCIKALGKKNIFGLGLPCGSLSQDLEDAKLVAKSLEIDFTVLDLNPAYEKFLSLISPIYKKNNIANANLKPRLRMTALYFYGQTKGKSLIAGTSNRAELAIGYFTKYGDGAVDFEPIASLYKQEVRKLAKILSIPKKIITKPPSAGLWAGQTDEDEIGLTYDIIDEILYRIDYNMNFDGLNDEDIQIVRELMSAARHKLKMPSMFNVRD